MRATGRLLCAGLACAAALGGGPAVAANARPPCSTIDRRVDPAGDPGHSQVERLNQRQLDAMRAPGGGGPAPSGEPGATMLGAPLMQQTAPSGRMNP